MVHPKGPESGQGLQERTLRKKASCLTGGYCMGKHCWKGILPKVLELRGQEYMQRMIAEELGYTYERIEKLAGL